MQQANKGRVSIFAYRTKFAPDVAVSISLNVPGISGCCLKTLCGRCKCDCNSTGCALACAAYALFLNVSSALKGDALSSKKSKVSTVRCGYTGTLNFSWNTKGTASAVRVSLAAAVKALTPCKLFSSYKQLMKSCGNKTDRAEFNHCAGKLAAACNAAVDCAVVGNIKPKSEHLHKMAEVVAKKLNPGSCKGSSKAPRSGAGCNLESCTVIKANGWVAHVIKEYVQSKAPGVRVCVCEKGLIVYLPPSQGDTLRTKLKKSAKVLSKRLSKLKDELAPMLAYLALSNGCVTVSSAKSLITSKPSASAVVSKVTGAL